MEEGASPPRWALDKKLGEDASMEERWRGAENWMVWNEFSLGEWNMKKKSLYFLLGRIKHYFGKFIIRIIFPSFSTQFHTFGRGENLWARVGMSWPSLSIGSTFFFSPSKWNVISKPIQFFYDLIYISLAILRRNNKITGKKNLRISLLLRNLVIGLWRWLNISKLRLNNNNIWLRISMWRLNDVLNKLGKAKVHWTDGVEAVWAEARTMEALEKFKWT